MTLTERANPVAAEPGPLGHSLGNRNLNPPLMQVVTTRHTQYEFDLRNLYISITVTLIRALDRASLLRQRAGLATRPVPPDANRSSACADGSSVHLSPSHSSRVALDAPNHLSARSSSVRPRTPRARSTPRHLSMRRAAAPLRYPGIMQIEPSHAPWAGWAARSDRAAFLRTPSPRRRRLGESGREPFWPIVGTTPAVVPRQRSGWIGGHVPLLSRPLYNR